MSVETFAARRYQIGWTHIDPQPCDRCGNYVPCAVLHAGNNGETPTLPIVALCRCCIVDGLEAKDEGWSK